MRTDIGKRCLISAQAIRKIAHRLSLSLSRQGRLVEIRDLLDVATELDEIARDAGLLEERQ